MGAVALGITSQVHAAAIQYFDSLEEIKSARQSLRDSSESVRVAEVRKANDEMDKIGARDVLANHLQETKRNSFAPLGRQTPIWLNLTPQQVRTKE